MTYPTNMPMIPAIPANTPGAGIGRFNKAKTIPQTPPVKNDLIVSNIMGL